MKFGCAIVYVPSVVDTLRFYQDAFGFETRFLHASGEYGELETGATVLAFTSHAMGYLNLGGKYQPADLSAAPTPIKPPKRLNRAESTFSLYQACMTTASGRSSSR